MKAFATMITLLAGLGLAIEFPRCRRVRTPHAMANNGIDAVRLAIERMHHRMPT